ncbi:MAG: beta-Ala-His dipeptidase [Eubacteriales bacterium]|nr:beta-Ala-His dipeptidase [Eubacteriales bacterium]
MENVLDHSFLPERYLEIICSIPHGSFHEKPLSDYLVQFAKERGLRYKQYPNWNVIIYKSASPGYEDHEPIMLQSHIDMVCEKEPGYEHDFEKDPLSLYVEDGILRAHGTTLGADDGVGVAYMLAFLEDDSLHHPPLECVFTVQEEVGLIGAKELAFEDISAKRMIGLDDMGGSTSYVSSCGSQRILLEKAYKFSCQTMPGYHLSIGGLEGGHSGVCINKERGNAIKLAARVLFEMTKSYEIAIGEIHGGGKDNVIATNFDITFSSNADFDTLNTIVMDMQSIFQSELEFSDPDVTLTFAPCECKETLSTEDSTELIRCLCLLPHGFRHKSMKIQNLTTVSENLANVQLTGGKVTIRYFSRSEQGSFLKMMANEIAILSDLFGFTMTESDPEPGWKYVENSEIRKKLFDAYHAITGSEMRPIAEHGGLETGFISGGIPGIDIVTCGPFCEGYHTTKEFLDLSSFRTIYEVLKYTLKSL